MKKLLTHIPCSASLIMLPLVLGVTSAASDTKTHPGSMCVRYAGSQPSYHGSSISNPSSTQWLYLDCPLINDSMPTSIVSGWVGVIDRHYSSNVRCNLLSSYWINGWRGWVAGNEYSDGSGNQWQKLNFGGVDGSGEDIHSYYSCAIPSAYYGNKSHITRYRARED